MRIATCLSIVLLVPAHLSSAAESPAGSPRLLEVSDVKVPVDQATLERQYQALSAMPSVTVRYSALGAVSKIDGETGVMISNARALKRGDTADETLQKFKDVLLATGNETLEVVANVPYAERYRSLKVFQKIRGIPVINGRMTWRVEEASGLVEEFAGNFLPDRNLPAQAKIPSDRAIQLAITALESSGIARPDGKLGAEPYLAYYLDREAGKGYLTWVVRASTDGPDKVVYVDAITGRVIAHEDGSTSMTSAVYNLGGAAHGTIPSSLPPALSPSQIGSTPAAFKARNNAYDTEEAWLQLFPGFPLVDRLHILINDGKFASPNGEYILYFSAQDSRNGAYVGFTPETTAAFAAGDSRDAVAHEYGHAVGAFAFDASPTNDLDEQSLALWETFSDLSAVLVDVNQRVPSPDATTWIIAEFYKDNAARGIRSIKNTNATALHPSGGDWYYDRLRGSAGFTKHYNSTIASHAFYLLANGGTHNRAGQSSNPSGQVIPSIPVTGLGFPVARSIMVEAFVRPEMDDRPNFFTLRNAAVQTAQLRYGASAATSTRKAFEAVGIGYQCTTPPATAPNYAIEDFLCAGRFRVTWSAVSGANNYQAHIAKSNLAWAFPVMVTDGNVLSCMPRISVDSRFRIRACNNCGCGPWSPSAWMEYWPTCL